MRESIFGQRLQFIVVLAMVVAVTGCVRRRLTVRSNPPGAMLYIDDQQIGLTPVPTDFVYYGTRKIKLVKDGYETMTTYQTIAPPWYEIPPLDFVSENLIGREIRDERIVDFQLRPQRIVPTQELLSRADGLRGSSLQGFVVPPVGVNPAFQPTPPAVPGQPVDPFLGMPQ